METFYRYTKNKQGQSVKVKLTPSQVKAEIMRINKWTAEEYKKQYDIFKNKLRSFEGFERKAGATVETQSARDLLYKEARAKQRYGNNYQQSVKMARIRSFTSISSGKALEKALNSPKYTTAREMQYSEKTWQQFKGLLEGKNGQSSAINQKALEIWNNVKDPVMREKALTDYANMIHAKLDEQNKQAKDEAEGTGIPILQGEVFGSEDSLDFDYSAYMT